MKLQMAWIPTVGWLLVAGMSAYGAEQEPEPAGNGQKTNVTESKPNTTDDAAQIRKLIPAASAMARQDWDRVTTGGSAPDPLGVEEKSLTFMLLTLPMRNDEKAKKQFLIDSKRQLRPDALAREVNRVIRVGNFTLPRGPVTFIHADRITDCTCKVEGDTAKGTVSFEAPKLYKGKVDYVAKRKDDRWQIEEFIVSAYRIHLVRNAKGMWVTQ